MPEDTTDQPAPPEIIPAKTKIFISWSGDRSKKVAVVLRKWIRQVIQFLDPWMSSEDIAKGERGFEDIVQNLTESKASIICMTPDNLTSEWVHFESGFIAGKVGKPRLWTFIIGFNPANLTGPLREYQWTACERDDVWKLVKSMNTVRGPEFLPEPQLQDVFDTYWEILQAQLNPIIAQIEEDQAAQADATDSPQPEMPQDEIRDHLREIVVTLRRQQQDTPSDYDRAKSAGYTMKRLCEWRGRTTSFIEDMESVDRTTLDREGIAGFCVAAANLIHDGCDFEGTPNWKEIDYDILGNLINTQTRLAQETGHDHNSP